MQQVKLLLKAGADVLYTNRWGDLAIDDARRVKATPVVELLEPLVEQVCEHVDVRGHAAGSGLRWAGMKEAIG